MLSKSNRTGCLYCVTILILDNIITYSRMEYFMVLITSDFVLQIQSCINILYERGLNYSIIENIPH